MTLQEQFYKIYNRLNGYRSYTDGHILLLFLFVFNVALASEVISRRYLLVAVILWPMCCYTGIPCCRHRTWHPTRAIHWCGTTHWNTKLPILMSWVRPDRGILPNLPHTRTHAHTHASTHTANAKLYGAGMAVVSQKLGRKCTVSTESCASPLRYPLDHSCFTFYS